MRGEHLLLHFLVGLAGRVHAVFFHGGEGLLPLLNHGILRGDLLLQQLAFLLHVGFLVAGGLQLLFIQLQRGVKGFYALLRLVHGVFELADASDAHLYIYARCHVSSPLCIPCSASS